MEKKNIKGSVKISVNIIVVVLIAVALMLFNIFVLDDISSGGHRDLQYWVIKIVTAIATLMLMFSTANITEESLKNRNKDYAERIKSLDDHYQNIMKGGENEKIDLYIKNLNVKAKYLAHIKKYKLILAHTKNKKRREKYEALLIMSPEEVWGLERPRVRYNKITWSDLAAGTITAEDGSDDNDLHLHRVRIGAKKVLSKALFVAAAGCYLPDFIYHFNEFTPAMILPLIMRFIVILLAIYSGIVFGYQMFERLLVVLKRKLKIFSEFRTRTDNNSNMDDVTRYAVTIERDKIVEKLKAKHAAENDDETPLTKQFKPISPGGLVKQIANKHILKNNR